jgi:hypothetical protein
MIMNLDDTDTAVRDALSGSLDGVTMRTPFTRIEAAGRALRRRHRVVRTATGVVAVAAVAFGVTALDRTSTAPPPATADGAASVHIRTVAYSVDSASDGTIHVIWDKARYFSDRDGLQKALRQAGFPVLIKEGVFCVGPDDDASLSPSGVGPGVDRVLRAESAPSGQDAKGKGAKSDGAKSDVVTFVFSPAAMPPGKQLFIGYLSPSQLAVTHGAPGSVERLISVGVPLTCTTQAPASHYAADTSGSRGAEPTEPRS